MTPRLKSHWICPVEATLFLMERFPENPLEVCPRRCFLTSLGVLRKAWAQISTSELRVKTRITRSSPPSKRWDEVFVQPFNNPVPETLPLRRGSYDFRFE